ncbi:hypothetical protein F5880DRAFT_1732486 [Lentinula raphanica]|nr:hypothetical protein F5880DRAFT_1732486 [Lentinula raphanica]
MAAQTHGPPFTPNLSMPTRLQTRLDDWSESPPKWQHKAYGPFNGYLSLRFPPDKFLVKAQSLLRQMARSNNRGNVETEVNDEGADEVDGDERGSGDESDSADEGYSGDEVDSGDEVESGDEVGSGDEKDRVEADGTEEANLEILEEWEEGNSVDSHGAPVTSKRRYPDFCVDQYWGADNDNNRKGDVIRVIIEIGSLRRGSTRKIVTKTDVEVQLKTYMNLATPRRWQGRLLGVGMLGNEVFLAELTEDEPLEINPVISDWISMFDPRFAQEMDQVYEYSVLED